ncbi:MAG TPA: cell wall-binding repeat-containing protein [Gryllotalpicola sp.]
MSIATLSFTAPMADAAAPAAPAAPSAAADPSACAPGDGTTPSLAVQDACGDHAMGSAVPQSATTPTPTPTASPTPNGTSTPGAVRPQTRGISAFATPAPAGHVLGFDISGYQPTTNWAGAVSQNYKFVFIKATESTTYVNSYFNTQWVSAGAAGLMRGAYHFAQPARSSGAEQAQYFYAHGASMSTDEPGTLPPVLDAETPSCGGLSKAAMVSWISSFTSTLKSLTGRAPIIYTYQSWWTNCTGNNAALAKASPLWIADPTPPTSTQPRIPSAWSGWTFWQWGAPNFSGGGDADMFASGNLSTLQNSYANYPRIAGTDRYATSTGAAQAFVNQGTSQSTNQAAPAATAGGTVYIANGTAFPDALSAGAAAGADTAPILLVAPAGIPSIVAAQLRALKPQKIVVLGGTAVISSSVQSQLVGYTVSKSASSVTRVAGADRYATSTAVATANFSTGVANVYITSSSDWPDALSGAAAAASPTSRGPVMLVEPNAIPATVAQALSRLKPVHITVLGGTAVLSNAVQTRLTQYTSSRTATSVSRQFGADRFATSAAIATGAFKPGVPVAYVASGIDFPDALSGAPLGALTGGAPVLLTQRDSIPAAIVKVLQSLKPKSIIVLGGSSSISASVQSRLQSYAVG